MSERHPPASDIDRDEFYSGDNDEVADEYELEPPDPEVLEAEKLHGERIVADARSRIDVDDLFRSQEGFDHDQLLNSFLRDGKFRFQTKHLLIATALVALYMAIWRATGSHMLPMFLYLLCGVSAALIFLTQKERLHEQRLAERKRKFAAQMRAEKAALEGQSIDGDAKSVPSAVDRAWQQTLDDERQFEFRFSLKQLLIAFTVSAVMLAFVTWMGAAQGAMMLGMVALVGLVIHAAGYEPPRVVTLGWWMLLALYVLLSLTTAFFFQ